MPGSGACVSAMAASFLGRKEAAMADNTYSFPHTKLIAYQLARQFVRLVHDNPIQDTTLRKHASDSVRSTAVHTAEGAARWSKADKSRVYVMARAECCEAVACYEVASDMGACTQAQLDAVQQPGKRVSDILSRLVH